ncbi:MAG: RNA-binding protein [Verrucomicrobiota bacterium]|nr:RNA-binding protein [Verrucomicrobiota bacterium]
MISNERPSPYGNRSHQSHGHGHSHGGHGGYGHGQGHGGHGGYGHGQGHGGHGGYSGKPAVAEDTLRSDKVQIERKTFVFTLKENPRGRFLRITEDVNGRRDTIIIPATGLEEFKKVFDEMLRSSAETPPKTEEQ